MRSWPWRGKWTTSSSSSSASRASIRRPTYRRRGKGGACGRHEVHAKRRIARLRAAVAERYSRKWGRTVTPAEVLVTAGAVNALAAIVAGIAEEGDEILVPDPGWPNYMAMIELARAVPVRYAMRPEHGYLPDIAEVESHITPRTKAIVINNPSNPTGAVFPEETVRALVELARKHDLWLITDEVYEDLNL